MNAITMPKISHKKKIKKNDRKLLLSIEHLEWVIAAFTIIGALFSILSYLK
ncbi:MAG: hypothetical protein ACYDBV_12445 [Nitrospiria bacterium]